MIELIEYSHQAVLSYLREMLSDDDISSSDSSSSLPDSGDGCKTYIPLKPIALSSVQGLSLREVGWMGGCKVGRLKGDQTILSLNY